MSVRTRNSTEIEDDFDRVAGKIPSYLLDSNFYYHLNFRSHTYVRHRFTHFEYTIPIGNVCCKGLYYVAAFSEHLLITRIGITAQIVKTIADATSFHFTVLEGSNPFDKKIQRCVIDNYLKLPCQVNKYQPYLEERKVSEKLDTGRYIRQRVDPQYQLELEITSKPSVLFQDLHVFIRVQTASVLGGNHDHPSWTAPYLYQAEDIVSYDKYKKYM